MRGKAADKIYTYITDRITPAYAGKRVFLCMGGTGMRDHPCVCGEKPVSVIL